MSLTHRHSLLPGTLHGSNVLLGIGLTAIVLIAISAVGRPSWAAKSATEAKARKYACVEGGTGGSRLVIGIINGDRSIEELRAQRRSYSLPVDPESGLTRKAVSATAHGAFRQMVETANAHGVEKGSTRIFLTGGLRRACRSRQRLKSGRISGTEFLTQVRKMTGIRPTVLPGKAEGEAAFLATVLDARPRLAQFNGSGRITVFEWGNGSHQVARGMINQNSGNQGVLDDVYSWDIGGNDIGQWLEKEILPPLAARWSGGASVIPSEYDIVAPGEPEAQEIMTAVNQRLDAVWSTHVDRPSPHVAGGNGVPTLQGGMARKWACYFGRRWITKGELIQAATQMLRMGSSDRALHFRSRVAQHIEAEPQEEVDPIDPNSALTRDQLLALADEHGLYTRGPYVPTFAGSGLIAKTLGFLHQLDRHNFVDPTQRIYLTTRYDARHILIDPEIQLKHLWDRN